MAIRAVCGPVVGAVEVLVSRVEGLVSRVSVEMTWGRESSDWLRRGDVERSDWLRRGDVDVSACFGSRKRLGPDGAPIARIHPCTSLRLLGLCRLPGSCM